MSIPKYEDEMDDNDVICPYCKATYQPDSETFDEWSREEECEECGKTYELHQSFSVTHHTHPDCSLNNEEHDWYKAPDHNIMCCNICEAFRSPTEEELIAKV
jgi:DNA-directed RNA polymerase subunit RPC12/RpoP